MGRCCFADGHIGEKIDDFICSNSLDRLHLRWFVLDITDVNIIFAYFMMFLFIFVPSIDGLLYFLNPLSGSVLMVAGKSNFIFLFVMNGKI